MHSATGIARIERSDAVPQWYALYTRHQHEKNVARSLSGRGQEVFLPLVNPRPRQAARTKELGLPLFPCYVFIYGGFDNPLEILKTPGLINVVAWGGYPAIIPPSEITSIRRIVESALRVEPYPYLCRGDRVRVLAGPLTGIEGIMVPGRNRLQLVVSLKMLGRSAAVEIEISNLERIELADPGMVQPVRYARSA